MTPKTPYPGLRPFDQDESEIFFGREEQVDELLTRLQQHRFLAVVGVSGCGKSSLVRAGVLPILKEFQDETELPWCIAELRPGDRPIANLAQAVLDSAILNDTVITNTSNVDQFLAATLRRGPLGLIEILEQARVAPEQKLLILVDQFEEIFRYHRLGAPDTASAFVDLLLQSVATPKFQIYVMLTMRSDFLGDCALFPGLPEALNRSQFLTPRLTRLERRAAIAGPANLFGAEIDPQLVNRVLNDMGDDPDQLPLMQHAMMRVWERTTHDSKGVLHLTLTLYEAIGGFDQALSNHANEAYSELSKTGQTIAEKLFRALCEKGPGDLPIRRPVPLQEIADIVGASIDAVTEVVDTFRCQGRSFLTPSYGSMLHPKTVIDISHESLIRHWDKMTATNKKNGWYQTELHAGREFQRLRESALRWHAQKGDPLSGRDLQQAVKWQRSENPNFAWAERYGGDLDKVSVFLAASVHKSQKIRKLKIGIVSVIILLMTLTLFAVFRQQLESDARHFSDATRLALQANQAHQDAPKRAMLLAVEAIREAKESPHRVVEAEQALRDTLGSWSGAESQHLLGHAGAVNSLTYSPDALVLASASDDGTIRLWETKSGQSIATLEGHNDKIYAIAFSLDGRTLASGSRDKTLRLWDVATGKEKKRINTNKWGVITVAFSPDGHTVASGDANGAISLWDRASGEKIRTLRGNGLYVTILVFSPNGKTLASSSRRGRRGDSIQLWDVFGGEEVFQLNSVEQNTTSSIAFSPNGKTLATGSQDKTIRLWDRVSGKQIRTFIGHTDIVSNIVFTQNGRFMISSSWDKTVRFWDAYSGKPLSTPKSSSDRIFSMAISPDGKSLATGSADNTIQLLKLDEFGQNRTTTPLVLDHYKSAILFTTSISTPELKSPNLVTVSRSAIYRHSPKVMDDVSATKNRIFTSCEEIDATVVNPTGDQLLILCKVRNRTFTRAIYEENILFLWDMTSTEPQELPLKTSNNRDNIITSLAMDTTGRWIYIGDRKGQLKRWNLNHSPLQEQVIQERRITEVCPSEKQFGEEQQKNAKLASPPPKCALTALALQADGRQLLVGEEDGSLRLWSLQGEALPVLKQTLLTSGPSINTVLFDYSRKRIISADRSGMIQVWQLNDLSTPPQTLEGHSHAVNAIATSKNGNWLLSGSDDSTVRLWNLNDSDPNYSVIVLRGHKGAVTTVGFDPEGHWLISGSNDNTVRLWTRDLDELEDQAKKIVKRNLTSKEWKRYFRLKECRKTFSEYPSGCDR